MGYRIAVDTIDQAAKETPQLAGRLLGLVVATVAMSALFPIGRIWMVSVIAALWTLLTAARLLGQRQRRRAALDRLVELEALVAPPTRLAEAVARRRARLVSARSRRSLARLIREALNTKHQIVRSGSPGLRALAQDPELAVHVADQLERDASAGALVIATERLIRHAGSTAEALDHVRRLAA
jgi:hypothetical protein